MGNAPALAVRDASRWPGITGDAVRRGSFGDYCVSVNAEHCPKVSVREITSEEVAG